MSKLQLFNASGSVSHQNVEIDTKFAHIEITEAHGVNFVSKKGEILVVSERAGGGFDVSYRSHYSRDEIEDVEPKDFDAGTVQFENAVIRRPGEEGYNHDGR